MKKIKNEPKASAKPDSKAKDKMAATLKQAVKRESTMKKGLADDPEIVEPAHGAGSTIAQSNAAPALPAAPMPQGHPKDCQCRDCQKARPHPSDCQCATCKIKNKKTAKTTASTPAASTTAAAPVATAAAQSAGIGTAKAVTSALNGTAMYAIARQFKKDKDDCKFTPEQLDAIDEAAPQGEIPRSWPLALGLTALFGISNVLQAKPAEMEKDVATLKKEHAEMRESIEHLKTYADQAKETIRVQSVELKRVRKEPLIK